MGKKDTDSVLSWSIQEEPLSKLFNSVNRLTPTLDFLQSFKEQQWNPILLGHNDKEGWFIIDGQKRLLACRILFDTEQGDGYINLLVYEGITKKEAEKASIHINTLRDDNELNALRIITTHLRKGQSYQKIAEVLDVPVSYVTYIDRKWAKVPLEIRKAALEDKMKGSVAVAIGKLPHAQQQEMIAKVKALPSGKRLTMSDVKVAKDFVRDNNMALLGPSLGLDVPTQRMQFTRGELAPVLAHMDNGDYEKAHSLLSEILGS